MKALTLSYFHTLKSILVETVYLAKQAIPGVVLGNNWHDVTFVPVKLTQKSMEIWEKEKNIWIENVCAGTSERYRNLHIHDWHITELEEEDKSDTEAIVVCRDGYRYGADIIWSMSAVFNDRLHEITADCREDFYSNPTVQEWFELKKKGPYFTYKDVNDYVDNCAHPEVIGIPPMEIVGDSHPHIPWDSDVKTARHMILKVQPGDKWAIASYTSIRSKLPEVSTYTFDGNKIIETVAAKKWHASKW